MTSCDETVGNLNKSGYHYVWDPARKKKVRAHRYVWEKTNGSISEGMGNGGRLKKYRTLPDLKGDKGYTEHD